MSLRTGWITLLFLLASPLIAEEPCEKIDDYVTAAMKEWKVPGLAIAIVKDGKVVLARGYGVCRADDKKRVDATTLFPVGSITKNFTATALALMVEKGRLQWDDPVTRHLPTLRFSDDYRTKHLTIRDLLCHRTGLERGDLLPRRGDVSMEEIVQRVRYLRSVSGFRAKWGYNNLTYVVAGAVLEKVSKAGWESVLTDRLLKPLNMTATRTSGSRIRTENRSHPHRLLNGRVLVVKDEAWQADASPAGSLYSNAEDMAKWLLACLPQKKPLLLKGATLREMQSIQMSIPVTWDRKGNPYAARFYGSGLGWTVLDYRGRKVCDHAGSSGTMFAIIPEENLGVVVLTNLEWTNLAGLLMYDVFDAYLVGPEKAWDRKKWAFWKKADPHPDVQRQQDLKKARAERNARLLPTLPLKDYAGRYQCDLYGELVVIHQDRKLLLQFGKNDPVSVTHWQGDTFYVRRPVPSDSHVDWLVTFEVSNRTSTPLNVKRLGWHEAMPRFHRVKDR